MSKWVSVYLIMMFYLPDCAVAARLTMDDKASLWPRATTSEKIDFADRMGRSFGRLSPDFDSKYFMKCLEEIANIGDTKDLRLQEMVKTCLSLSKETND